MSPALSPLELQFLDAARIALALIKETWTEDHGARRVAEAWGALERAIAAAEAKTVTTKA